MKNNLSAMYRLNEFKKDIAERRGLKEDVDYGTGPVEGKDIFDTSTLGGFSYKELCIPGNKENEYMKNTKNRVGEIV